MSDMLHIRDLVISYETGDGPVRALDSVDLVLASGGAIGVVGESGSGKSTLSLAIGKLLPTNARRLSGDLAVDGRSVFSCSDQEIRSLRRQSLGFVFQNPMTALDPTMRVGTQVRRAIGPHARRDNVMKLLMRVELADIRRVSQSFPHQLSGGMAQRVAIAIAIARQPRLLIADEPTASLDASIRDQILQLLSSLRSQTGASLILFTHDLRVVFRLCERVAVMYGGRIVEQGETASVFRNPGHPYTSALMAAAPGNEGPNGRLVPIRGAPSILKERSLRCVFTPRCPWAIDRCGSERPETRLIENRLVACHRAEEVIAPSAPAPRAGVGI
jgi:oligopeptide/dipeptide ABC transporter ATP-binding protein